MFEENGLKTIYLNYNDDKRASVYVFAVGSRHPQRWEGRIEAVSKHEKVCEIYRGDVPQVGTRAFGS